MNFHRPPPNPHRSPGISTYLTRKSNGSKGESVSNPEQSAKTTSPRTGAFATLSNLLPAKGTGASSHRRTRLAFAPLLAALALLALTASPAFAAKTRLTTVIGPEGTSSSAAFANVQGVAINQSTEGFYVFDAGAGKVYKFNAAGDPVGFSGLSGNVIEGVGGAGNGENEIAVAPAGSPGGTAGNIYVANNVEVLIYAPDGTKLGELTGGEACGVATNPAGHVLVGFYPNITEYTPSANPPTNADQSGASSAEGLNTCNVAADGLGHVYAAAYFGGINKLEGLSDSSPTVLDSQAATLAVNPSTNDVYADQSSAVALYDSTGALLETFGSPQLSGSHGIAVNATTGNPASGDVYVGNGETVVIFGPPVILPTVVTGEATGTTAGGSATLAGTVNPEGIELTECAFDYGPSTAYGLTVPCAESPAEIGAGESAIPVHADLTGLQPGGYHFRLIAANANGSSPGGDETFAIPGAPAVFGESANATGTEADLRAQINPGNAETTYHFEYGPTAAYGQSTPDMTIAAGEEAVSVSAHITGLIPGATYHFRAVATNSVETTNGPDQIFTTPVASSPSGCSQPTEESPGFRSYLPDCRAYELVSPSYTQGATVIPGSTSGAIKVARSGDRVEGFSIGTFAGQESGCILSANGLGTGYAMNRTALGWRPEALAPPCSHFPFASLEDADAELGRTLFDVSESTYPQAAKGFVIREPNGNFVSVGPESPGYARTENGSYRGGSADLSRIVFGLARNNPATPEALWPGDTTIGEPNGITQYESLYEYNGTGNSEPKLVAVENQQRLNSNQEAQLITQCGAVLGSPADLTIAFDGPGDRYNAVSPNGFAVFFTAHPGLCTGEGQTGSGPTVAELYARIQGARTVAISEPSLTLPGRECTGACREAQNEEGGHTPSPGLFAGASADGQKVFFVTPQPLVNSDTDETADLYLAELDTSGITRLVDVSHGGSGDPTPGNGANVQGVSRVSEDGSRVYFVARGILTSAPNANGEAAVAGANNLYLYEPASGRTAFVADLAAGDSADWSPVDLRPVQASAPDGRFLVFTSQARPQGTGDTSAAAQLFEYDAESGTLTRISIGQRGSYPCPQSGEVEVGYNCNGNVQNPQQAPRIYAPEYTAKDEAARPYIGVDLTSDGTVFFQSAAALTPSALNGYPNLTPGLNNVYEYRQGNVYLVSAGNEPPVLNKQGELQGSAELIGSTADGAGLLFYSGQSLVPQDSDSQVSIYDAQTNGGFPAPFSAGGCAGESCRGAPSTATVTPTPGSASQHGVGNAKAGNHCAKGKKLKRGKCVPKKHRKHQKKHRQHKKHKGGRGKRHARLQTSGRAGR